MRLSHLKRFKVSFADRRNRADITCKGYLEELKMSTCTHESMTNHHVPGVLDHMSEVLHTWRQRYRTRRELTQWTERDLHDVGLSWSDVAGEAEKPFWRA
jgi:uncharacterized protein YjiS (DUF1127 family)